MRKMFKLLVVLFIIYFAIQYCFYFFGRGHNITYNLKINDMPVVIEEILKVNKEETDGYYININFDNKSIPFKILKKYNRQKKIVTNVDLLYGDTYTCAFVNIKNDINATDIKCLKDGMIYYYSTIKGNDSKLDSLVSNTQYNVAKYTNDTYNGDKDNIRYYPYNYVDNYGIVIGHYQGVYLFGNEVTNKSRFIQLFSNDVYSKDIEGLAGKYYITADYNASHEFVRFNAVNILTGTSEQINSEYNISFNSFVQGSIDNKLYLIDINNKRQYSIDPKSKKVEIVGDLNRGAQIYTDEGILTKNINEVIDKKIKFFDNTLTTLNDKSYDYIRYVGDKNKEYYIFEKRGQLYDVYLVYSEDISYRKNYVFTTTDINRLFFKGGYVYYINEDELKVFGSDIGNKTLIKYSELKYNPTLKYYVY